MTDLVFQSKRIARRRNTNVVAIAKMADGTRGAMEMGSATVRTIKGADMGGLRHHGNQDWTPGRKHNIANRVGQGVAEGRKFALRFLLNGAKRGGDRPSAGTRAQNNDWIHLQHISAEQDRDGVREDRDHKADKDETDPGFLQPRKETGSCCETHASHEDR